MTKKIHLVPQNLFLRKLKKLRKKDRVMGAKVQRTLDYIKVDPFQPKLKTHKAIIRYDGKEAYSSRVTGDIRIAWRERDGEFEILDLLDLGGHRGRGNIYR